MLITKLLLVAIDSHSMETILWKSGSQGENKQTKQYNFQFWAHTFNIFWSETLSVCNVQMHN